MFTAQLRMSDFLQNALKEAARRSPTQEELHKQRVSFVYSFMGKANSMTKADVERMVDKQEGRSR